jgi:hypothetical protein
MGKLLIPQSSLFNATATKDVVFTPSWLAALMVKHFAPDGRCLDPCKGDGAFYDLLPVGAQWCEIAEGRDFFAFDQKVDWAIGNPPYSCLLGWIRHSFKIAQNVAYLMPLHRVFASYEFIAEIKRFGGIREILIIGTGTTAGFPFGHCLGAVHYQAGYTGETRWTFREEI